MELLVVGIGDRCDWDASVCACGSVLGMTVDVGDEQNYQVHADRNWYTYI